MTGFYFKLRILLLICVVWGTIFTDLAGQSNLHSETRYRRRLDEARKYFNSFKYDETEKVLTRLIQKFPDRVPAWILLGQMAGEQHRTQLMDSAYSQVLNLDSTDYPEAYYQVALIRYRQGMYREASQVLARYERNRIKKDTEAKEFMLLRHRILFALDQISRDSILTFPVAVSGINTPSDEYHPSLSIDGRRLVFTRQKQNSSGIMTEDLYESQRNSKGWTHPVRLPEPINSNGNEGAQTMRQDGRELIFTACNRPDTKGSCDLYFSVRKGNQWSFPKNLGYPVNTRYWESTPALTPDGRFLVFSSNRPGGMGGMDLWIAENLGANNWSEPKNLGPHINTNGDEVSPFIYYDSNKLFFSSNGLVGMGGFDLFTISFSGSSVSGDPVNLGYPVNTHADETGLTLAGLPGPAVISSNRTPGKGRDLFYVELPVRLQPEPFSLLQGKVTNKISGEPLSAKIIIKNLDTEYQAVVESDPDDGHFLVGIPSLGWYRIEVGHPGYLFYSESLRADTLSTGQVINREIALEPIRVGSSITLRNIFFDFDSDQLKPESFTELDAVSRMLQSNPHIRVEISGHTDSIGTPDYNRKLSMKRAEAVCNYLLKKGINKERLHPAGYGSDHPLYSNSTLYGRRLNRRTELKIVK